MEERQVQTVRMPETAGQTVVFTAITAWLMVYVMTLYHTALAAGRLTNGAFLDALGGMWMEFVLIFLCALLVSGRAARCLAFRIVTPRDRPIVIITAIQVFTVLLQVALASVLGVYRVRGFTSQFVPDYLTMYCRNFIMALPVQLFLAGPAARALFRRLFPKERNSR